MLGLLSPNSVLMCFIEGFGIAVLIAILSSVPKLISNVVKKLKRRNPWTLM